MVAGKGEGRLQRPSPRLAAVDLMKIAVDTMLRIASDHVDVAATFDHRMFAGRDRQARHLAPTAGVLSRLRNAGHVALLLNGLGNIGDGFVVQAEEERKLLF